MPKAINDICESMDFRYGKRNMSDRANDSHNISATRILKEGTNRLIDALNETVGISTN